MTGRGSKDGQCRGLHLQPASVTMPPLLGLRKTPAVVPQGAEY